MFTEEIMNFDLQLFAEPEEVEDDDPSKSDDDDSLDVSSIYDEDEEDDEEEPDEEESDEEEPEAKGEEEEPDDSTQKVFTQEEVNQIVGSARIKGREVEEYAKELEKLTGMDMKGVIEHVRNSQVKQKADELGLTDEEAEEMVEKDRKLAEMEKEMEDFKRKQEEYNYNQEKARFQSDPLVKKYEKEIDAFSRDQGGKIVIPFESAMKYVLGEKLASGEIKDNLKAGTENQTLANLKKKKKVAPETGSSSGKSGTSGLSKDEKALAKAMGVDPKEWAKQKSSK